jgi:hypothetical protein
MGGERSVGRKAAETFLFALGDQPTIGRGWIDVEINVLSTIPWGDESGLKHSAAPFRIFTQTDSMNRTDDFVADLPKGALRSSALGAP